MRQPIPTSPRSRQCWTCAAWLTPGTVERSFVRQRVGGETASGVLTIPPYCALARADESPLLERVAAGDENPHPILARCTVLAEVALVVDHNHGGDLAAPELEVTTELLDGGIDRGNPPSSVAFEAVATPTLG